MAPCQMNVENACDQSECTDVDGFQITASSSPHNATTVEAKPAPPLQACAPVAHAVDASQQFKVGDTLTLYNYEVPKFSFHYAYGTARNHLAEILKNGGGKLELPEDETHVKTIYNVEEKTRRVSCWEFKPTGSSSGNTLKGLRKFVWERGHMDADIQVKVVYVDEDDRKVTLKAVDKDADGVPHHFKDQLVFDMDSKNDLAYFEKPAAPAVEVAPEAPEAAPEAPEVAPEAPEVAPEAAAVKPPPPAVTAKEIKAMKHGVFIVVALKALGGSARKEAIDEYAKTYGGKYHCPEKLKSYLTPYGTNQAKRWKLVDGVFSLPVEAKTPKASKVAAATAVKVESAAGSSKRKFDDLESQATERIQEWEDKVGAKFYRRWREEQHKFAADDFEAQGKRQKEIRDEVEAEIPVDDKCKVITAALDGYCKAKAKFEEEKAKFEEEKAKLKNVLS